MKKFATLVAATFVASVLLAVGPIAPASADTGACVGAGNAATGSPLYYPGVGPKAEHTSFAFALSVGACATDKAGKVLVAFGTLNGYCGLSSGRGNAHGENGDVGFWFIDIGGKLVIGGHITGTGAFLQDSSTCLTGVNRFIVLVAVVKSHVVPQTKPTDPDKFPPALPNLRAVVCAGTGICV